MFLKKLTLLSGLVLSVSSSDAQQLPKWELGVGVAGMHLPYYRGAATDKGYALPYPYIIYRGDKLNVDEDGVRGFLYKSDGFALDLSLAGGLPVPSDQNGPRRGMHDLAPTFEFGPSAELRLWHNDNNHRNLWLRMPVRSAFSVGATDDGGGIKHQGWVFAPFLEYSLQKYNQRRWKGSFSFGPIYADDAYHDYFYGVAPQYATPIRPTYQSRGGYSGSRVTFVASKQFGDFWISAFARTDTLKGAVFDDSPLVETRRYHILGTALTWVFSRSAETVNAP